MCQAFCQLFSDIFSYLVLTTVELYLLFPFFFFSDFGTLALLSKLLRVTIATNADNIDTKLYLWECKSMLFFA